MEEIDNSFKYLMGSKINNQDFLKILQILSVI